MKSGILRGTLVASMMISGALLRSTCMPMFVGTRPTIATRMLMLSAYFSVHSISRNDNAKKKNGQQSRRRRIHCRTQIFIAPLPNWPIPPRWTRPTWRPCPCPATGGSYSLRCWCSCAFVLLLLLVQVLRCHFCFLSLVILPVDKLTATQELIQHVSQK